MAAAANGGANGGSGPKKRLGDAVGWFKGLGQAATSMVGAAGVGRAADAAEDPEYIKVRVRVFCWCLLICMLIEGGAKAHSKLHVLVPRYTQQHGQFHPRWGTTFQHLPLSYTENVAMLFLSVTNAAPLTNTAPNAAPPTLRPQHCTQKQQQ